MLLNILCAIAVISIMILPADKLQRKMTTRPENDAIRQLKSKLVTEVKKSLDRIVGEAHTRELITDDQRDEISEFPATKQQKAEKFMGFILYTVKDSTKLEKFRGLLFLPGCIDTQRELGQELSKQVASHTLPQHVYVLSG